MHVRGRAARPALVAVLLAGFVAVAPATRVVSSGGASVSVSATGRSCPHSLIGFDGHDHGLDLLP